VLLLTEVDGPTARVRAVARDGTLVWQTAVPYQPSPSWAGAMATPVGDGVALLLPGEVRILDASGATLRTVGLAPDDYVSQATDDAVVVRRAPGGAALRNDGDTVSVATDVTTVVRADSTVDVTGSYVSLSIDDGSVPDLVLTADPDGLHAWDQAGGARWTADAAGSIWHTTALAGRVHVSRGEEIVTLDATTGEELWRTGGLSRVVAHLTDGRYLVTLAPSSTPGGQDVVGIDPADGAIVWRTPLDAPVDTISSVFGVFVASDMQTARVTVLG